ncbi:stalk domain-containing protein [Desulfoscipio sp. XC116]|uniref:stalk domain-containing protein n=1 Tax=Desulfoscipio sp. XC116 TaxID=3144975 RepID=UPI00325B3BE3
MGRVIGKSEFILLVVTLFSLFTVIMPVVSFAADNDYTKYSSTYAYITADDNQEAGTATVRSDDSVEDNVYAIQIKLSLPDGAEFTDKPVASGDYAWNKFVSGAGNYGFVKSYSNSITIKGFGAAVADWDNTYVTFDFSEPFTLDIDSDFTGNLETTIEVWGLTGNDPDDPSTIAWSESDTVTIAKVGGDSNVLVSAKSSKTVSTGSNKKGAEIRVYETQPKNLGSDATDGIEEVYFDILTSGVTFNDTQDEWQAASFGAASTLNVNPDDDQQIIFTPEKQSSIFPGNMTFTPYLDVDSDVTGDIKIRVTSKDGTVDKTTVVAATVTGIGARARIEQLENNDTVISSGEIADLDVSFKIVTEGGSTFKASDIMTFRLNEGKFATDPRVNSDKATVRRYDNNKAFYVYFNSEIIGEITLDSFKITLDNDVEPGDITLTISGDYGDLGDVTIGIAALPIIVKSTEPSDKATNIKTNNNIQVNFNQKIQKGNDFNLIGVKDNDNNAANVIVFIEDKNLIISPVDSLGYSTTYTVNIPAAAIKNLTGNTLNNDVKFTFTTRSNSNVGGGAGPGGGGNYDPPKDSVNDISEKVNDLLKNAGRGDTITIDSAEIGPKVINYATLHKITEAGCNFSIDSQEAKVNLAFEPGALLVPEREVGESALIEISALIANEDEDQDAKNYAISVGGKVLRAYNFNISVKETEEADGTEIHTLNGNANVVLDLSDMDLDEVNTDLLTIMHKQSDGTWVEMESVYDPVTKTLRFNTNSFSMFAIIERMEKESKIIKLTVGQTEAIIDDNIYVLDTEPYVSTDADRIFVPLRFISETLGAKVDWVDLKNTIIIKDNNNEITLTIGSKDVSVNNHATAIDCAPELLPSGKIFVPLRFISETLGATVEFDPSTKQITINR